MDKKQFEIDQLRKDKIIYATEAMATSVTGLVVIFALGPSGLMDYSGFVALGVILYWAYAMLTNLFRLRKIRRLESQL